MGFEQISIVIVAIGYGIMFAVIRWHLVAKPTRCHLKAEIELARSEAEECCFCSRDGEAEVKPAGAESKKGSNHAHPLDGNAHTVHKLLTSAEHILEPKGFTAVLDKIFWSRGREYEALHYIRRVDELLAINECSPRVKVRLFTTIDELSEEANNKLASDLVEQARIHLSEMQAKPDSRTEADARAWFREIFHYCNNSELLRLASYVEVQNRTMWSVYTGLLLIVLLVLIFNGSTLILAGMLGGFLSRMNRVPKMEATHSRMMGIWAGLFVSPVIGGLTGWAGVLLAAGTKLNISGLEVTFGKSGNIELTVALLCGISERFFDRLLKRFPESRDGSEQNQSKSRPANTPDKSISTPGSAPPLENSAPTR